MVSLRFGKFEVTDKAIGVCTIDFRPVHREPCIAYGADLFCKYCLREMFALAVEHGLIDVPREEPTVQEDGPVALERPGESGKKEEPSWACPVCGREFPNQQALAAHSRTHRGGGA